MDGPGGVALHGHEMALSSVAQCCPVDSSFSWACWCHLHAQETRTNTASEGGDRGLQLTMSSHRGTPECFSPSSLSGLEEMPSY